MSGTKWVWIVTFSKTKWIFVDFVHVWIVYLWQSRPYLQQITLLWFHRCRLSHFQQEMVHKEPETSSKRIIHLDKI